MVAKPIVWGILMNKTDKFTCIVLFSRYHRRDFPAVPALFADIKKPLTAVTIKGSK